MVCQLSLPDVKLSVAQPSARLTRGRGKLIGFAINWLVKPFLCTLLGFRVALYLQPFGWPGHPARAWVTLTGCSL